MNQKSSNPHQEPLPIRDPSTGPAAGLVTVKFVVFRTLLQFEPLQPRGRAGSTPGNTGVPHAPGNPIRQSLNVWKAITPCESHDPTHTHRMASNSPPNRKLCFPCVKESWSPTPKVVW